MEVLIEEEAEIDYNFAKSLIANVIEHISSADESPPTEKKTKKKFKYILLYVISMKMILLLQKIATPKI